MNFKEFEDCNIVAERAYSWEVEADSQQWEAAIDGIESISKQLWSSELEA
jgi:hypothetical protein